MRDDGRSASLSRKHVDVGCAHVTGQVDDGDGGRPNGRRGCRVSAHAPDADQSFEVVADRRQDPVDGGAQVAHIVGL
jgi:hypothetical protein